jgi:hypothetical protein
VDKGFLLKTGSETIKNTSLTRASFLRKYKAEEIYLKNGLRIRKYKNPEGKGDIFLFTSSSFKPPLLSDRDIKELIKILKNASQGPNLDTNS